MNLVFVWNTRFLYDGRGRYGLRLVWWPFIILFVLFFASEKQFCLFLFVCESAIGSWWVSSCIYSAYFKPFNDNGYCRAIFVLSSCSVFVCSLCILQYRSTISLNVVNWLFFGMDTCECFLRGRNWSLCITVVLGTIPQSFPSGLVSKTGRGIDGGETAK